MRLDATILTQQFLTSATLKFDHRDVSEAIPLDYLDVTMTL